MKHVAQVETKEYGRCVACAEAAMYPNDRSANKSVCSTFQGDILRAVDGVDVLRMKLRDDGIHEVQIAFMQLSVIRMSVTC